MKAIFECQRSVLIKLLMGTWVFANFLPVLAQQTPQFDPSKVSLDQKLNSQVPLEAVFKDEEGKTIQLGAYFGKKPVVLVMPFYRCPGICKLELEGMVRAFGDKNLKFKVGKEFTAITISIDPRETPELAAASKREYLEMLGQPNAASGWHFLTGEEAQIKRVADAVGFRYIFDAKTGQYVHPAGIIILTPHGKTSQYVYGTMYDPTTLRLALIQASANKIGTPVDKVLLWCSQYDPTTGKYGLTIFRVLQIAGLTTVVFLGSFIFLMLWFERKQATKTPVKTGV
jgi:protein SCO1/2